MQILQDSLERTSSNRIENRINRTFIGLKKKLRLHFVKKCAISAENPKPNDILGKFPNFSS